MCVCVCVCVCVWDRPVMEAPGPDLNHKHQPRTYFSVFRYFSFYNNKAWKKNMFGIIPIAYIVSMIHYISILIYSNTRGRQLHIQFPWHSSCHCIDMFEWIRLLINMERSQVWPTWIWKLPFHFPKNLVFLRFYAYQLSIFQVSSCFWILISKMLIQSNHLIQSLKFDLLPGVWFCTFYYYIAIIIVGRSAKPKSIISLHNRRTCWRRKDKKWNYEKVELSFTNEL